MLLIIFNNINLPKTKLSFTDAISLMTSKKFVKLNISSIANRKMLATCMFPAIENFQKTYLYLSMYAHVQLSHIVPIFYKIGKTTEMKKYNSL